jgi:hypothetical protein
VQPPTIEHVVAGAGPILRLSFVSAVDSSDADDLDVAGEHRLFFIEVWVAANPTLSKNPEEDNLCCF